MKAVYAACHRNFVDKRHDRRMAQHLHLYYTRGTVHFLYYTAGHITAGNMQDTNFFVMYCFSTNSRESFTDPFLGR